MTQGVELSGDGVLTVRDRFEYSRKQLEACWAIDEAPPSSEALFDGAIRGGKSQAYCRLLVAWAWKYGGTYVVSRATYRELEDSTKKIICYGDGGLPPACPPELLKGSSLTGGGLHEGHNELRLRNGAVIKFRSLEPNERGKIRNMTLNGWLIDQAEELEDEDILDFYLEVKGRLSDPRGPRKVLLVANPSREDHWLHTRFIDPITRASLAKGQVVRTHASILDNAENLPDDVVAELLATEHTAPDFFARMVLGLWGVSGGKRFKQWNPALHVIAPFAIPRDWEIVEAWDYGWDHPTVATWHAQAPDGRWFVVAEHVARETAVSDHAAAAKKIRANRDDYLGFSADLEPSSVWMDPSAFAKRSEHSSIAHEFLEHGILVARARNDRIGGWNRIGEFLKPSPLYGGLPRMQVFNTCRQVIREIPNLTVKPGTDDVEKINDDAADTVRYGILSRHPAPSKDEEEEDPHSRRALMRRARERAEKAASRGSQVWEGSY